MSIKNRFKDVTEAAQLLIRRGAELSLKDKVIRLPMSKRGLRTLAAADFVAKTYEMELIDA